MRMFGRLYKCYKDDFDLEMSLWKSDTTFKKAQRKAQKQDEWF